MQYAYNAMRLKKLLQKNHETQIKHKKEDPKRISLKEEDDKESSEGLFYHKAVLIPEIGKQEEKRKKEWH